MRLDKILLKNSVKKMTLMSSLSNLMKISETYKFDDKKTIIKFQKQYNETQNEKKAI